MNMKQNPTGLTTAAAATPVTIVVAWIAAQLGVEMDAGVAAAFGAIIASGIALVTSYFTPRGSANVPPDMGDGDVEGR